MNIIKVFLVAKDRLFLYPSTALTEAYLYGTIDFRPADLHPYAPPPPSPAGTKCVGRHGGCVQVAARGRAQLTSMSTTEIRKLPTSPELRAVCVFLGLLRGKQVRILSTLYMHSLHVDLGCLCRMRGMGLH